MRGERVIDGKHYLMNGRFTDFDRAIKAAEARKADGYLVRIVKVGLLDYVLYEFPLEEKSSK